MTDRLGLLGYDSYHFVVENIERSKKFYADVLDFKEVAHASADLVKRSGQQSIVFGAGDARVCVSTPLTQSSKAARFLKRHPSGVMSLSFRVKHLEQAMKFLEKRGGTLLADPVRARGRARRHVQELRDRDAPRRRRVPLRRAKRLPRVRARLRERGPRPLRQAREPLRHRRRRPRDVERPHDAADHCILQGSARLRAVLGDRLPHAGRRRSAEGGRRGRQRQLARRLGPEIDRHVGSRERGEVRDERAAPPRVPRVADLEIRRGQPRAGRAAHRVRREGDHPHGGGHEAPRRRLHGHAEVLLPSAPRSPREARHHQREGAPRRARAPADPPRRPRRQVHAPDLHARSEDALRRRARGPVLLRDHPARGRQGLRLREFPRALREHRAVPEGE